VLRSTLLPALRAATFAVWLSLLTASSVPAAGEVLRVRYAGELIQRNAVGAGTPVRAFELQGWTTVVDGARTVISRIDDDSRGGLAWFERCSSQERSAEGRWSGDAPHLRHLLLDRPYLLTIPGPILPHPVPLAADAEWTADWEGRRVTYRVAGAERVGDRNCWKIEGSSDTGRRQQYSVEKETDLLVAASLRIFIGQGERFDLQLQLQEAEELDVVAGGRELTVPRVVLSLQEQIGTSAQITPATLSAAQLTLVEAALPGLQSAAAGTGWEKFIQRVAADIAADRQRGESLELLAARRVGKPAPEFSLTDVDGRAIDRGRDAGNVVVLHFWDYRGSPEAPFGQVGYLDFLASKRKADGVRVYGVAVDERLADPGLAIAARREVRQFGSQFLRVDYPVAIDDGALLATFGDPRPSGAALPLWIVIGADGKVVHYKAGLYAIDPNRGLEELNAAVTAARRP